MKCGIMDKTHTPHSGFQSLLHLVTQFLLSISNYSPVYVCLELGSYHHSPTTEYLEFCFTQFSKFLTLWLERSPMWTLSWQDKINSIAFYTSKLSNCLKGTCWQYIRINWNLGKSGKERGSKRRMRVCIHDFIHDSPKDYGIMLSILPKQFYFSHKSLAM